MSKNDYDDWVKRVNELLPDEGACVTCHMFNVMCESCKTKCQDCCTVAVHEKVACLRCDKYPCVCPKICGHCGGTFTADFVDVISMADQDAMIELAIGHKPDCSWLPKRVDALAKARTDYKQKPWLRHKRLRRN